MFFTKSIRWRMISWLAFLLTFILTGYGFSAYQLHRTNLLKQIDDRLSRRLAAINSDLRGRAPSGPSSPRSEGPPSFDSFPPPERSRPEPGRDSRKPMDMPEPGMSPGGPMMPGGPGSDSRNRRDFREVRLSTQTMSLFDAMEPNDFYYVVWSRGGTMIKSSAIAPANVNRPDQWDAEYNTMTRINESHREMIYFSGMGECILVGKSITSDMKELNRFAGLLILAGIAVLGIGLGGGWMLTSRALRPVEDISVAANRISAGNLSERINVDDTDNELGRLATVLNSTFARLEASFAQQRQLTADVSHELRTPLSVLISEAQTTLARERSATEYRETIVACLEAGQQMKRMTQSLLKLARFDAGQENMNITSFNLAEHIRSCIDLVRPLIQERHLQLEQNLQSVVAFGDADRLHHVILNLLTNAIQYNKEGGKISLLLRSENNEVVFSVSDSGEGIGPEDLPHVFKRFYRADKSRSMANGNCGLGLAIAKAIVDAHKGTISVSSQPGVGTTFTVTLPAAPKEANPQAVPGSD